MTRSVVLRPPGARGGFDTPLRGTQPPHMLLLAFLGGFGVVLCAGEDYYVAQDGVV